MACMLHYSFYCQILTGIQSLGFSHTYMNTYAHFIFSDDAFPITEVVNYLRTVKCRYISFEKGFFLVFFFSFFTFLVMSQTDLIWVLWIFILPSNNAGFLQFINTSLQLDEWALNLPLKFAIVYAE